MADAVLGLGGTAILHETFDPEAVLRTVVAERITDIYLAVPHLYRLIEHPDAGRLAGAALRRIVYSGTPAAPHRIARAVQVFGGARLTQVYGSTEAGGIASLVPLDHGEPELLGTVGRPFPWVRVRVVDPSTGLDQPTGTYGEVWVRSDTVMTGYVGMPQRGAEVHSAEGWLRTGDLGRWDRHGYLTLAGRLDRLINIGGLWVCPSTVEQALLTHPDVHNAAVYSIRDLDRVEYLHAAVELRPGASRRLPPLRDHVAGLLSLLHAPHAYTLWDRMPVDDNGRPDRARLRTRPVTGFVLPTTPSR
jgi:acyl-CoA synthetase (AMP-forming)/AMP-acid ligase II